MKKRLSLILLNIMLCLSALAVLCGYTATALADETEYTVKFWLDGAKTVEYDTARQTITSGDCAVVPVTPTKEGNFFLYWKLGEEKFSFKTPIIENVDLTAEWLTPDESVTVTEMFSVKFVVAGTVVNEQSVEKGDNAIAPTGFALPDGKLFLNWDRTFTNVQEDITVNANLASAEYTVKFIGFNDVEINTVSGIRYGDSVDTSSVVIPPVANYHVDESDKFIGDTACITEDCEIYVKYIPNQYNATFKVGEETYGLVQTINYGEYVECPPIPEKQGYIFKGWFSEGSLTAFDFNTLIEGDVTLFAKYQIIENPKYNVTFYNYDGIQYGAVQRVEEGKTAIEAGRPAREGYDFLGWFVSGETRNAYDFNTPVTEDVSLYAQFKIKYYTVTVMSYGEIVGQPQTVKYGGNAVEPAINAKEGDIFTGFDASFKDIRKDTVINATFRLKTFAVMFIDSYGKKMCATQYVEYGKSAKAPKIPTMEGYNFIGWTEDYENVTDDMVVIPLYEKIKFQVEYYDGDALYETKEVEYGSLAINLIPEKEDYIFAGWFTDESCETVYAYDFNTPVKGDLVLYGAWELKPIENYTVKFMVDGAIFAMYSVEHGHNCPTPDMPNKYGYNFTGWDGEYSNVTEDLEINAIFTEKEFNIYLRGYAGAGSDDFKVKYGTFITDDMLPASVPNKEGYTFDGWNYDVTQPITQDVTISARYTINVYTVTFIVAGEEYNVQQVEYNGHAYIPSQPYVFGKSFGGWYVGENAFSFRDGITDDVTVTAKLITVERTVYYYLDNQYYAEEKYEVGAKTMLLADPVLPEHTDFNGWSELPETMPNATVSVYGYTRTHYAYTVTYYINNKVYVQETYYDGDAVKAQSAPSAEDLALLADADTVFIEWDEVLETMPTYNCRIDATLKKYYYLTYSINGYYHEQLRILEGTAITPKTAPKLPDGVVFVRWENEPEIMPQYNTGVEGTIMRNYTITYYVNGKVYTTREIFQGDAVTPIGIPTEQYEDFVVDGWDGEPETMPTYDVEVHAIIRLKYTITYYIDAKVCATVKVPVGDAIPKFNNPETDVDTVFVAWLNLPESGIMPSENINVYASVKHYFTLTYEIDGAVYKTFRILEGEPIRVIAYENDIEGIIFYEWQNVIDVMTGSDYTITASIKKLYKYVLTYLVNGEEFARFEIYEGETITPFERVPELDDPDAEFCGWVGEPADGIMPQKNVNVYADIKYYYEITYYVHGEVYDTVRAIAGATVQKHAEPDNLYENERFIGWQGEPTDGVMPAGGARVDAVVRTLTKYTITYYVNNEPIDTRKYYETTPVTPYGTPKFEDENTIFDGWDNEPKVMPSYDIDVYGYSHIKEEDLTLNRFMLNVAFADDKELTLTFMISEEVRIGGFIGSVYFNASAVRNCRIDLVAGDNIVASNIDDEIRFAWANAENATYETVFLTITFERADASTEIMPMLNIFEAYAFDEEGTAMPVEYSVN